jgi:uncharacterized protein (TIGR02246 family)
MKDHAIRKEIELADSAINRKDFDAVADCYTDDAVLIVAPGLEARGREEIRRAHKNINEYFCAPSKHEEPKVLIH